MKTSFPLSKRAVHATLKRHVWWFVVASAILATLLVTGRAQFTASEVAILVASIGSLYLGARTFSWVSVTRTGIVGPVLPNSPRVVLNWDEPIVIRSSTHWDLPVQSRMNGSSADDMRS